MGLTGKKLIDLRRIRDEGDWKGLVALVFVFLTLTLIFYRLPVGIDWRNAYRAARDLRHYDRVDFIGIPFSLLLVPHIWLPLRLANAVNLMLNFSIPMVLMYKYRVGIIGILAVYLCPPFFVQMTTNNIEWLPLVGFLLPPVVGTALIAVKPQALGGVVLIWIKRRGLKVLVLLPIVALVTVAVWGLTPLRVIQQAKTNEMVWNYAPWPVLIPVGLWLLWTAWREDDEFLAAGATPMLVPYIAGYTLPVTITVVACKYPKLAAGITVLLWWMVVVENRRYG